MTIPRSAAPLENAPEAHRHHQWQALLDSAGEGIWGVDATGACTFVNRMATELFGFSAEEMLGRNMHSLVHHHHADGEAYDARACPVYGVFKDNTPMRHIADTLFRKDGSSFLAELSAQPVTVDGGVVAVVVTFRDVTDVRQHEADLHRAYDLAERRTAELDAVIESIPHGIYIATRDGQLRSNQCARAMTGEKFPHEIHTLDRALVGEASTETVQVASGWVHSTAAPIFLNGEIMGSVAVNTDITQSRMQEEALRRSEKLAAVGQLASSIAHEINNPLESITNLLFLISASDSLADVHEYTRLAQAELSRVTEITLQTLRFHRQQTRPGMVDVADLLRTILALYTGRLLVRSISLETRFCSAPSILCLEGEIRQVVNNLVRNAVDAMASGGRLLIRVHRQCGADHREGVRITIADSGSGIDARILQHLYEPFQTTKELTGTGLGLWVSKGIVDKHQGDIRVRTRRGLRHGTVFAIWLPTTGIHLVAIDPAATASREGEGEEVRVA